ncbi:cdc42 effector protein 5 isoform X1 [Hemibagrus wyckioides]|uniref:cdc42 effector protein 5 isoform X1 n=1 Tax=Hemibagrus wyckioides TaxID=337641 RepID=UPI00266B6AD7|nr:cdc42 effector protein 5 isoform X1 [Hemibagrus wyckioides]
MVVKPLQLLVLSRPSRHPVPMPLHKSGRGHRLDPTMISAPLGDFRHTMHIGRGGDAFGDTSFLSSHGPSNTESFKSITSPVEATVNSTEVRLNHEVESEPPDEPFTELQHSESVSSFDLDLDLGPSILGDVLGVMDGLGLGSKWTTGNEGEEEVFISGKSSADGGISPNGATCELNEKRIDSLNRGEEHLNDVNGIRSKGLRPKVRFSDRKEEIVGRQYVGGELELECEKETSTGPDRGLEVRAEGMANKGAVKPELTNHRPDISPSPSSSVSSEYEGISPLDRRREEDHLSESDSDEEGVAGEQGYTFEDESDDEIGL